MQPGLRRFAVYSAFSSLATVTYPATAHHSTTMFDHATVVSIAGTVKEVHWTNPHVAIFVYGVSKEGDEPALWVFEMTSPGNLVRAGGWSRTAVKPGDKVTVSMAPLRDGSRGGALKKITMVDTGVSLNADIRDQEGTIKE